MLDAEALAEMLAPIIEEHVSKAVEPLTARIAELESRPAAEKGDKGDAGERGADGLSPEPEAIAAALLPTAEDVIAQAVGKAVSALPLPERGEKGDTGERGAAGEPGQAGRDGIDGKDAAGIVDALKDSGELVLTLADGRIVRTGIRDGEKGLDGRDGFSFDEFDCQPVDERTIKMMFVRGEVAHSYELQFPVVIYRGVFKDGDDYERGDMVTWGGSLWHCDTPTKEKPGTDSWTLAAKKGRDGKDAKHG